MGSQFGPNWEPNWELEANVTRHGDDRWKSEGLERNRPPELGTELKGIEAQDLAVLLGISARAVNKRADREGWPRQPIPGRGRGRVRRSWYLVYPQTYSVAY